jgi:hypothetical protein
MENYYFENKKMREFEQSFKNKFEEVFDKLIIPIENRSKLYDCYKKWLEQQEIKSKDENED